MENEQLKLKTEYLFNRVWDEEISDEASEEYLDKANELIAEYGWPKVFEAWNNYLHEKCISPDSVVNFANLYWTYCGDLYSIPEPHKFLGYMLYKIDNNMHEYSNGDIIESLAVNILSKAGYKEADLFLNPYYSVNKDSKLLSAVDFWKSQNA